MRAWGHQCALYVGIMVVEKIIITGLLALQFWASVRELILAPITSPQARVVIVVLVIPFFVNVSTVVLHQNTFTDVKVVVSHKKVFCSVGYAPIWGFLFQALIFWVTDNFLMVNVRKITRGDGSIRENNSSSGMSRVYSKVSNLYYFMLCSFHLSCTLSGFKSKYIIVLKNNFIAIYLL